MHYYRRNIGDYYKKAGRLTIMQHGVYTLLIDACYDRERFPTEQEAIEWCWASSEQEITDVKFILTRFFKEIDGLFVQNRIYEDLRDYHELAEKNAENGRKGGRPKGSLNGNKTQSLNNKTQSQEIKTQTKANETQVKANESLTTNHKPLTTNQEPVTNIYVPFCEFWEIYPKKVDKKEAEKEWKKARVDKDLFRQMQTHLASAYISTDKQYIPGPARYIRREKWNDEIISNSKSDGFDSATPSWERRCDQTLDAFSGNTYDGELN